MVTNQLSYHYSLFLGFLILVFKPFVIQGQEPVLQTPFQKTLHLYELIAYLEEDETDRQEMLDYAADVRERLDANEIDDKEEAIIREVILETLDEYFGVKFGKVKGIQELGRDVRGDEDVRLVLDQATEQTGILTDVIWDDGGNEEHDFRDKATLWLKLVEGEGDILQLELGYDEEIPEGIKESYEDDIERINRDFEESGLQLKSLDAERKAEEGVIKVFSAPIVRESLALEDMSEEEVEAYFFDFLSEYGFVGECLQKGTQKAIEIFFEKADAKLAHWAGFTTAGLCLTEKENCAGEEYWSSFTCGVINGLLQEVDLIGAMEGLEELSLMYVKNKISCINKGGVFYLVVTADNSEEAFHAAATCFLGMGITLEELSSIYGKVSQYVSENWSEPYLHGQTTVFVASLALPVTKLSKLKKINLLNKLKANPNFSSKADDLTRLANAEDDDIGRVLDDLVKSKVDVPPTRFRSLDEFASTFDPQRKVSSTLRGEAWNHWKKGQWKELENLFVNNKINAGWPPNRGFVRYSDQTLETGYKFDRYGGYTDAEGVFHDRGSFASPLGASFESRALPSDFKNTKYFKKYEVIKPIPGVKSGEAIPWFGQPGMGIQHELPENIDNLVANGFIKEIN